MSQNSWREQLGNYFGRDSAAKGADAAQEDRRFRDADGQPIRLGLYFISRCGSKIPYYVKSAASGDFSCVGYPYGSCFLTNDDRAKEFASTLTRMSSEEAEKMKKQDRDFAEWCGSVSGAGFGARSQW